MDKYLQKDFWITQSQTILDQLIAWLSSPQFYAQVGAIIAAILIARITAKIIRNKISWLSEEPDPKSKLAKVRGYFYAVRTLIYPALCYIILGIAAQVVASVFGVDWLIRIAISISVVFLIYKAIDLFIKHPLIRTVLLYICIPIATLHAFGWLDQTIEFLDSVEFKAGNIRLSLYFLIKTAIVGGFFFWLGSTSNKSGQNMIRSQKTLDIATQELIAKLFQIALFAGIFILALQVLGLDLTALAVFGGAIAVGIGFGLQQIASNFISGLILLMERTITVGDFIELEDGRSGILKELNMRSATLETFDGKELFVPNEKFITGVFINWTHDDPRQRYEVEFSVSYDTDITDLPELIVNAASKHPSVLQEPEKPDCELREFGDSGIKFALEFWIEGVDDGKNRISADLLTIIWKTLRDNDIKIPYPQREVRVLSDEPKLAVKRKPANNTKK